MIDDDRPEPGMDSPGMDLDRDEEPQYLRRQKRVEVRKRLDSRKFAPIKIAVLAMFAILLLAAAAWGVSRVALNSTAFLLTPEHLEIRGARYAAPSQVVDRFSGDMGKSVFAIRLDDRKSAIEQIPWVERADVLRIWPGRVRVVIHERTPVAFAMSSDGMLLVDGSGVILDRPIQGSFSFPVVVGISEKDAPEQRSHRMRVFTSLMQELDSGGAHYGADISEVDVSDPENARVTVVDGGVLLQLGNAKYLDHYKTYLAHVQEWRRDFPKLRSIDLRYDRQVVVNP